MADYRYRARNPEGKEVKGVLRAANEERAAALLRSHALIPLEVAPDRKESLLNRTIIAGRFDTKDLVVFSRQLSAMIRAGVPILQAIKTIRHQESKPVVQKVLDDIAYNIEGGESLSSALTRHPDTFSLFYVGIVKTGEASGRLSESLEMLAEYLERNYNFMRKIKAALTYPIFVLVGVVIVVIITFSFVVPQLIALFEQAEVALPLPTRILIAVTQFGQSYWYLIIAILIAIGFLARSYLKTTEGQYTVSSWALHIPLISPLVRKIYLSRLTAILHTLFSSDVPVIESLRIAEGSIGNRVYQRILRDTADAVKNGSSMSDAWVHEPFIPAMLTTMVGVGERSGEIENAFSEAEKFFHRDVEDILNSISVFLEPLMVIILGIGVGFIVAAVLLPIYNLVLVL